MSFDELGELISREKKIVNEMNSLFKSAGKLKSVTEKKMAVSQIHKLKVSLKNVNKNLSRALNGISLTKKLPPFEPVKKQSVPEEVKVVHEKKIPLSEDKIMMAELEKITLKRLKKGEKVKPKYSKERKPSGYVKVSNKLFSKSSLSLVNEGKFRALDRALIKSNMQFTSMSYLSVIFFTTFLSVICAVFLFFFLLFFNIQATWPIITMVTESFVSRFGKVFWILFIVPIGTFFAVYFYPFLEQKAIAHRINQELPFAAIHMAAISGSMIDPTKMFGIIIATGEYPYLEKEFTKLINEINVYGYNLVSALRTVAFNSPSPKLAELFNGMATTVTSGGDLQNFFEKRSDKLLFEHRLEREKETKSAETFMDIYVSVVIAAPMILMLLLMMIQISGIGIALSTNMISLIFVLGVSAINILFLTFLHLKQSAE